MVESVLLKADTVRTDPFPHIVIDDCLPDDYYRALSLTFPEKEILQPG
jgi:hypothetical protein